MDSPRRLASAIQLSSYPLPLNRIRLCSAMVFLIQSWRVEDVYKRQVMSMVDNSLMVEDYSDIQQELDGVYGDLID